MGKVITKTKRWLKERWDKKLQSQITEAEVHAAFHITEKYVRINSTCPNLLKTYLYRNISLLLDVRIFTLPLSKDMVYVMGTEEDTTDAVWWINYLHSAVESAHQLGQMKRAEILAELKELTGEYLQQKYITFRGVTTRDTLATLKKMAITSYEKTDQKHKHLKKRLYNGF